MMYHQILYKTQQRCEMEKVKLYIAGETYGISTDDDIEYIEGVAAEIDAKIKEIMESSGRISITQAATLTALEYADRYKKAEQTSENLRSQIHSYLEDAARSRTDAEIARRENERLQNEIKLLKSKK